MTIEQWNLLSNLVHCYDEYCGHASIDRYIEEQNALPAKVRYRHSSVKPLVTSIFSNIQVVFEKNRDFFSLFPLSRSNLLRTTVQYDCSIGGLLLTRQHHLFDNELLCQSVELIFRSNFTVFAKWMTNQLDPDETFVKLVLAIVAFSTTHSIVHVQPISSNLIDAKRIFSIQNICVELTWRYLLHRYNHDEAVIRFLNIIRCLILISQLIIEVNESEQLVEMTEAVIKQVGLKLKFSNEDSS